MRQATVVAAAALAGQVLLAGAELTHVRTEQQAERRLIDDALERSATLRQLVERLERSRVVVYVSFGRCWQRSEGCLQYLTSVSGLTYVRATLNRFDHSPAVLAGLLGHELQHALELAAADVRSREEYESFLAHHARRGSAGYETDAAVEIGRRVEREVSQAWGSSKDEAETALGSRVPAVH